VQESYVNASRALSDDKGHDHVWQVHQEGFSVEMMPNVGPARERFERELLESGVAVPLSHRSEWARAFGPDGSWFLGVRDANGKCCCGFAVEVTRSRAMPGHLLLRVQRFGVATTTEAASVGLRSLVQYAQQQFRVLRLYVELFSKEPEVNERIATVASSLGLHEVERPRSYRNTVVLDLTPDESDIFSGFDRSARRNVRASAKKGFEICPITDPIFAHRMDALLAETMARSGGRHEKRDWAGTIEFSNRYPTLSRLAGTFRPEMTGPESLVAFAWGCNHGDHVTHTRAASTRSMKSNVPLSYALAWDLISWAKTNGASWFDFGGVTQGSLSDKGGLGGISDFKRFFSKEVSEVGREWILEPHPFRAKLARFSGAAAAWAHRSLSHR
jgi:hypothetical protein